MLKSFVFQAYWPYLHVLTLYKIESFQNIRLWIILRNVCLAVAFTILFIGYTIAVIAQIWYSYQHDFKFGIIATPLGIGINSTQIAIVFVSMVHRMDQVNCAISQLRRTVENRKFIYTIQMFN